MQRSKFRSTCPLHDLLFCWRIHAVGDAVGFDVYRIETSQGGACIACSGLNHEGVVFFAKVGSVFSRYAYPTKSGSKQRESLLYPGQKFF